MSPLRPLALLALAAPALLLTAGTRADAALPAPTTAVASSPTGAPSPTATPSPVPGPLRVGVEQDGTSVALVPGQLLRVELSGGPWQGLDASTPLLQLLAWEASGDRLAATLQALAPGGPQRLQASSGPRTWSVEVRVGDGAARDPRGCRPAPGPSGTPTATAQPTATASPGGPRPGLLLEARDDGRRLTVREDDPVFVRLDDCAVPFGVVRASGPLRRESGGVSVPDGQAEARFLPTGAGTATLSAPRDLPCSSRTGATCPTPWQVVLDVVPAPCEVSLSGPASVPAGSSVLLTGAAPAGTAVQVLFRRRGEDVFTVRRRLVAGADGGFTVSWAGLDDHRWYATTDRCSTAPGLTQVQPQVTGPAVVRRGAPAQLVVRAAAGSRVGVLFRRAGTTAFVQRRSGTVGRDGRWTTSFRPDVDHAWAATSLGRRSAPGVTKVR